MAESEKTSRGLDANVAAAFCYALGWVTGLVFFLIEPSNKFVRFHALQSVIVFGALSVLMMIVRGIRPFGILITTFFIIPLSAVLWLLLMFKAYKGEKFRLPIAGEIAEQRA